MDYKEVFEGKTVAELDEMLGALREVRRSTKEAEKEAEAAAKANAKAELENANRETLKGIEEGATVTVIFKGEEVEAEFAGLTEKRFNVMIDGTKKSIMLDKLVTV